MLRKSFCLLLILLSFHLNLSAIYPLDTYASQLPLIHFERTARRDTPYTPANGTAAPHTPSAILQKRSRATRLWPGSRYTESDRLRAITRGMRFIYRTALNKKNFDEYGHDYLWCFYTLGSNVQDVAVRQMAQRMGVERARRWRRDHPVLPPDADAGTISNYAFGCDAADSLGVRDDAIKEQIRRAAPRFTVQDYLRFDPVNEPPPIDVPEDCASCGAFNSRGSKTCLVDNKPLRMRNRYDVWYDALITTYVGEHYGVRLGARYVDVLKWLPTLRPYRGIDHGANPEFYDIVYAITHIVYTLNNYSMYRLSPEWLPQEFEFLKTNLKEAIKQRDADMLGEFMDSLRAFGVTTDDPSMRAGVDYLLSHQNVDGSWGYVKEKDIYNRYHPTWNAVAGLSEYAWRSEGLSFPEVKPLLEQWKSESNTKGEKHLLIYSFAH